MKLRHTSNDERKRSRCFFYSSCCTFVLMVIITMIASYLASTVTATGTSSTATLTTKLATTTTRETDAAAAALLKTKTTNTKMKTKRIKAPKDTETINSSSCRRSSFDTRIQSIVSPTRTRRERKGVKKRRHHHHHLSLLFNGHRHHILHLHLQSSSVDLPTHLSIPRGGGEETEAAVKAAATVVAPSSSVQMKLILLTAMVLQNSAVALIGRYTRSSRSESETFLVRNFILVTELAKLVLSSILESITTKFQLYQSLQENIFHNPLDSLKVAVPALLYLLQNSLLYVALSNLSAPLFQVTYQCKLLTTALVSVIMMGRVYNVRQWICLSSLSLGVAVAVLGEKKKDDDANSGAGAKEGAEDTGLTSNKKQQSIIKGLLSVTVACISSAIAGVYFEKVLKKRSDGIPKPPVSLWIRNMQLSFFSVIIALLQREYHERGIGGGITPTSTTTTTGKERKSKPLLHGFTPWVWILVGLQAGGGMLIAAVMKHADNVLKGLATGVAVAVSTIVSTLFLGTPLTSQFVFGAIIILNSVYFFSVEEHRMMLTAATKVTI